MENIDWKKLLMDKGVLLVIVVLGGLIAYAIIQQYLKMSASNMVTVIPPSTSSASVSATSTSTGYHGNLKNGTKRNAYDFPYPNV